MIRRCKNPECQRYYFAPDDPMLGSDYCCRPCRVKCDPEFERTDAKGQEVMRMGFENQGKLNAE